MKTLFFATSSAIAAFMLGAVTMSARADILYVSNYGNGSIEKITSGGVASTLASNPEWTYGVGALAFDSKGNLYEALTGYNGQVLKITPGGVSSVFVSNSFASTGLTYPSGLAFDSADNLYVSGTNNQISRYTPNGVGSVFASGFYPTSGLARPFGLAFDSAGNLYAVNSDSHPNSGISTIEKFTPAGVGSVFASSFATGALNGAIGLAFDSTGNLYATSVGLNATGTSVVTTITKFTPGGVGSTFARLSDCMCNGHFGPGGLAFDSTGNLYAANYGSNTIEKFTPGGVGSVFASSGLNNPYFLAFTNDAGVPLSLPPSGITAAVPEPSTWALFALGIAGLAGSRRLKIRSAQ